MSRDDFWEFTPRELYDEIEVIRLRQQDQFDRDMTLAWHVAALHRQKRLPSLATLLSKRVQRQTQAEQRAMLHHLSEQYGIPLKVKGKVQPLPKRSIEDMPDEKIIGARRPRSQRRDLPLPQRRAPVKARPRGR